MRKNFYIFFLFTWSLIPFRYEAQSNSAVIKGIVVGSKSQEFIEGVAIRLLASNYFTSTNKKGEFIMTLPRKPLYKLTFSHISYRVQTKDLHTNNSDTLILRIIMAPKSILLDSVSIFSKHVPETLIGKPNSSIYDFDFYEDKLLLLTAEKSLAKAQIQLSDYNGKVYSSYQLPKLAGEAKKFFHDYEGYTNLICEDSIFRLDVFNTELIAKPIRQADFNAYLKPVSDTLKNSLYINNQWEKYPSFNYYFLKEKDSISHLLSTITNEDLMKLYNFEYYYLPSRMQLEARRMADYYKVDVHIIAALMSGFTQSLFYDPLYAPLFAINDTICIFNHHTDFLYHYNKQNKLIDSVKIAYHHPKNWREWKKQLFVDEAENKVYAFFSKNGHHYLKQINHQTGKAVLTYKLQHHSAENIKIKEGYVYYVYRPFGSTQERFLYRERIE